jgi:hypothetical protein
MRRHLIVFSVPPQRAQKSVVLRGHGTTGLLKPSALAS